MDTNLASDSDVQPEGQPEGQNGRPGARSPTIEAGGPVLDFLTLEEASRELGTGSQGVVLLAARAGIPLRRLVRSGRTLSGLSRAEVAGLQGELMAPAATPAERDLRRRLLEAERALEEARTDRELAREACQRLARANERSTALEARIGELSGELEGAQAETRRREEELVLSERRAGDLRRDGLERERDLRLELARERERGSVLEGELAAERLRSRQLEAELRAAEQLEAASARFVDQLERKLDAATHTIAHLRRRTA